MKFLKNVLFSISIRVKYKYSNNPLDKMFYKSILIKMPLSGKIKLKTMRSILDL